MKEAPGNYDTQKDLSEKAERVISSLNIERIRLPSREMAKFLKEIGLNKKSTRNILNLWKEVMVDV